MVEAIEQLKKQRGFGHGGLRLVALKLLAEQPMHGYQLIKAVEELTADHYKPSAGVVYPLFSTLLAEGFIQPLLAAQDSRQQRYEITGQGKEELAKHAEKIRHILARIEQRARQPVCVTRAIENFKLSVRLHLHAKVLNDEQARHFAAILDHAVKQIEDI